MLAQKELFGKCLVLFVSPFPTPTIGAQGASALIIEPTAATANSAPVHHNADSHHGYDRGKNKENY